MVRETEEALDAKSLSLGINGALYVNVKDGAFEARFTPETQTLLAPILVGEDSEVRVSLGGSEHAIRQRIAAS